MTTPIEKIIAWQIVGNAHHDRELFDAIHDFVMSPDNPMVDKIKAIEKLDATMGVDSKVTASDVTKYIQIETGAFR